MNSTAKVLTILALALPFVAQAADFDICKPVFDACSAQAYTKDDIAPIGKKIWLNCASVILEKQKKVTGVDIDPMGFEATNCRQYRAAKQQFDAEWVKNHQKPSAK